MVQTRRKSYGTQNSPPVAAASPTATAAASNNNNTMNDDETPPRRQRKVNDIDKELNRLFNDLQTAVEAQANLAPHDNAARDLYSHHMARIYKTLLELVDERIQAQGGSTHIDTPVPPPRQHTFASFPRTLADVDQDVLSVYAFLQTKTKEQKKKRSPSSVDSRLLGENIVYTQQRLRDFIQERIHLQEENGVESVSASLSGFSFGISSQQPLRENADGASGIFTSPAPRDPRRRVSFADRADSSNGRRSSSMSQFLRGFGSASKTPANTPSTASRSSFGQSFTPAPTAGFTSTASVPPSSSGFVFGKQPSTAPSSTTTGGGLFGTSSFQSAFDFSTGAPPAARPFTFGTSPIPGGPPPSLAQAMERTTEFGIAEGNLPDSLAFGRQSSVGSQQDAAQQTPGTFSTRSDQAVRSAASSLARSSLGSVSECTPFSGSRRIVRARRMS